MWGTPVENAAHKVLHGTAKLCVFKGAANPMARLTESDVRLIRTRFLPQRKLAGLFDVKRKTIARIQNRKRWKHVV